MKNQPKNVIGANIKKMRLDRQITQKELASRIGKSRPTVVLYESGFTNVPGEAIIKIAAALNCTSSDLVNSAEDLKKIEHKYISQIKKYQVNEPSAIYNSKVSASLEQIHTKLDAISAKLDKLTD